MVLTLLAILIAGLVVLAALSAVLPRNAVTLGCAGASGLVVVLAVVAMADTSEMATLALSLGPAGMAVRLALDPLSAGFLLLLFLGALASALCGRASPLLLAGMVLAVLAADAFSLVSGLLLLGGAGSLRPVALGAVCLIVALALADPTSFGFAELRTMPPDGWRAGAIVVLVALAASALAGTVTRAPLAIYLLMRLLLDLGGPAQPVWSVALLLVVGGIAMLLGPLRAAMESTLHSILQAGSLQQLGMAAMGVGLALLARAVDRPDITLLALQAAWIWLVCLVLCQTLLLLCAAAVEGSVETRRLDRLGGLVHGMPVTTMCALAGLFGVAMLPPGLGFAALWLLFQSLLAIARTGGLGLQFLVALLAALTALSAGLTAMASVRLFGVAFLGRPRTPRTAVAEEAPRPTRLVMGVLAGFIGLLGALPVLALLPAAPALALLAGGNATPTVLPLFLRPSAESAGYSPIALAGLLALVAAVVFWTMRRTGLGERRREPAWSGGFAPPPNWLPFGDPATQYGPASFAEPLRLALAALPAVEPLRPRAIRLRRTLADTATALRNSVGAWSISAALAVLVLAIAVWAMAS